MKAWVTKYWQTLGIFEVSADLYEPGWIRIMSVDDPKYNLFFPYHVSNIDFATSLEAAMIQAYNKKSRKIASLKRQIKKLERMVF